MPLTDETNDPNSRTGGPTLGPYPASNKRPVHHPEWDQPSSRGYIVSKHLINEPPPNKPFKIIVVGAGAAGIDFLHHAPSTLDGLDIEIVCYEKNADVGGTWYENRYPGCACDVPSISYSFPWRPNPSWKSFYSSATEIWEYMKSIVDEEGMMKYIQLHCQVVSANWNEERSKWALTIRRLRTSDSHASHQEWEEEWEEECDFWLNGAGFLKFVTYLQCCSI